MVVDFTASAVESLIERANPTIQGGAGGWHFVPTQHVNGGPDTVGAPKLTPNEVTVVQRSAHLSNLSVQAFPSASSSTPVTVTAPVEEIRAKVISFLHDFHEADRIADDVVAIHNGGAAHIPGWEGWEAELHEDATRALADLLDSGVPKLGALLALFSAQAPIFAAIGGMLAMISPFYGKDIVARDKGTGVRIGGTFWALIQVEAL